MHTVLISKLDKNRPSFFAMHFAIALAENFRVALVNYDLSNDDLQSFMQKRQALCAKYDTSLPTPIYFSGRQNILEDLKRDFQFIILDGADLSQAKDCDTLLTIVTANKDVHCLTDQKSDCATKIWQARQQRALLRQKPFDWVVLPVGPQNSKELFKKAPLAGYRPAPELVEESACIKGLQTGLTVLDKNIPCFIPFFKSEDFFARRNLKSIIEFVLKK